MGWYGVADDARLASLVADYAEWMHHRQRPLARHTVRMLLEHRADYLDDEFTRWTGHDVADMLVGLLRCRVMVSADETEEIVVGMRSFLEYLGESGQLHPLGERLDQLLVALDEIGEELAWALEDDADPELDLEFDLGGRLDLPADFSPGPVRLAPEEELAAAARSALALVRLETFVNWVGNGRSLTEDLELSPADVSKLAGILGLPEPELSKDPDVDGSMEQAEVHLVWDWAEEAGFVTIRGSRLVSTPAGRAIEADPLSAWKEALESLLEIGVVDLEGNGPPWGQTVDEAMADLVVLAHLREEPVSLRELVELLWEAEDEELADMADGDPETWVGLRDAMAEDVARVVEALVDMGALAMDEESVVATPLGRWVAVQLMRDDGYDVPVVGELATLEAARLFGECESMDLEDAAAELAAWLEARSPEEAVAELADAARTGTTPQRRSMFFFALDQLGADAGDAVRSVQDDPVLRPYATAWLIERGLEERHALSPEDLPKMLADQLAAMLAGGGPDALLSGLGELGPPPEQVKAIEAIWRVEAPAVSDVLDAIGRHHPTKAVAKAARKAGFKRRDVGPA